MKKNRFNDWTKKTISLTKRDSRSATARLLEPWSIPQKKEFSGWSGTKKSK